MSRFTTARMRPSDERGSASLELAIITPAVVLLIMLLVAAGRIALARQALEASAFEAARSASLARSSWQARTDGEAAARANLSSQGVTCTVAGVNIDTSGFSVQVGQPASVTARVTCVANLGNVAIPGLPGQVDLSAEATSPLDTYRDRQ